MSGTEATHVVPAIELPETFDIQQAVWAQATLSEMVNDGAAVEVDGRSVRRTDAAAMQVLAAAAREAANRGVPFALAASDVLSEAASVLGLTALLRPSNSTSQD